VQSPGGVSVDISLAALPFEDAMMARAIDTPLLEGKFLRVCSVEDLLVMKIFAGREIDTRDARSIVTRKP
jgi:hypothetical protein